MTTLRNFSPLVLLALGLGVSPVPALAQSVPAAPTPGMQLLIPGEPLTPKESAQALEKRTDVANAKLPPGVQAVREARPLGHGAAPATPVAPQAVPPKAQPDPH